MLRFLENSFYRTAKYCAFCLSSHSDVRDSYAPLLLFINIARHSDELAMRRIFFPSHFKLEASKWSHLVLQKGEGTATEKIQHLRRTPSIVGFATFPSSLKYVFNPKLLLNSSIHSGNKLVLSDYLITTLVQSPGWTQNDEETCQSGWNKKWINKRWR